MKRLTSQEQKLVSEGRDVLHAWAVAAPNARHQRSRDIAAFLRRLGTELPLKSVLPLFIGSAAFAAVFWLARDGRAIEAGQLLDLLDAAADEGACPEGSALVAKLRRDLATYYGGNSGDTDGRGRMASARAAFRSKT